MSSREATREDLTPTNQSTPLPKITTKTAPPPPPPTIPAAVEPTPAKITPPTPTSEPVAELLEPTKLPDNFKVFI